VGDDGDVAQVHGGLWWSGASCRRCLGWRAALAAPHQSGRALAQPARMRQRATPPRRSGVLRGRRGAMHKHEGAAKTRGATTQSPTPLGQLGSPAPRTGHGEV
jgi:hypothetical protein